MVKASLWLRNDFISNLMLMENKKDQREAP